MKVYAKIFEKNGSKSENVNINFNSIEFKGNSFFFEKTLITTGETNNDKIFEIVIPNLIESEYQIY
jgi:hypothetical protein